MAGPGQGRGWAALLLVAPLALVLAWSQRSTGPSRIELAQAVTRAGGEAVSGGDIRSVRCGRGGGEQGIACRWQQREAGAWRDRGARLVADAQGWRLVREAR